jgi:hypothetical protein
VGFKKGSNLFCCCFGDNSCDKIKELIFENSRFLLSIQAILFYNTSTSKPRKAGLTIVKLQLLNFTLMRRAYRNERYEILVKLD